MISDNIREGLGHMRWGRSSRIGVCNNQGSELPSLVTTSSSAYNDISSFKDGVDIWIPLLHLEPFLTL